MIAYGDLFNMIAAVEPAAVSAEFENDFPDIRRMSAELKSIMRWLAKNFPDEWSA